MTSPDPIEPELVIRGMDAMDVMHVIATHFAKVFRTVGAGDRPNAVAAIRAIWRAAGPADRSRLALMVCLARGRCGKGRATAIRKREFKRLAKKGALV